MNSLHSSDHPDEHVEVNGRTYRLPSHPTIVITVDGGDPAYVDDALQRGTMPQLASILASGGRYQRGRSEIPSLTNPNNMSIVTGAPPAVHGIPGNYHRQPNGERQLLNSPEFLRAPSIHAELQARGVETLMVTAKDKLRRLLARGGVPSISVEKASELGLPDYGIDDVEALVGRPAPGIYDPGASLYALELALAIHQARPSIALVYCSLTDRVQHAAGPGEPLADEFFRGLDTMLGRLHAAGFVLGLTADHGMSSKHDAAGEPNVRYLASLLEQEGIEADVLLPITDPYVRHHGALGGFAWVEVDAQDRDLAMAALARIPGVEEVWPGEQAAVVFELPADRVGAIAVCAAGDTAFGTRPEDHDLSGLHGPLRSHGGRHEQLVPLVVNRPVTGALADLYDKNCLRNRDIHDLVLNHCQPA